MTSNIWIPSSCLLVLLIISSKPASCHDGDDEHDQMHAIQMTSPAPELMRRLTELSRPSKSRSTRYHFEWAEEPEITRGYGEKKLITNCINTGDHPTDQTISTNFAHTFEVDDMDELDLEEFLQQVAKNYSLSFTTRAGVRSLIHDKVMLEKRTKSTVSFCDHVIKFNGLVRKVFNTSICDHHHHHHSSDEASNRQQQQQQHHQHHHESPEQCKKRLAAKSEEIYLAVKATETDPSSGKALGTFSSEYFGTDKYKHPSFYNLPNRMIAFDKQSSANSQVVEGEILSPYHCADQVALLNKTFGLYQVNKMRCTVADPEQVDPAVSLLDRDGKLIGHFDYNTKLELDTTTNSSKFDEWKSKRTCDIILATGKRWHCKKFHEKPSNVVMFRRSSPVLEKINLKGTNSTSPK